ncbi:hypothetical protein [Streptomyces sp. D2-8]|uniref:hypothetical protein n=1 Tax=Streptomyces sp. D2-8 TaxID=2707767 RepID=UPI0020C00C8F|nr:hypothetical protein [Streptomyces sp. D2-8]
MTISRATSASVQRRKPPWERAEGVTRPVSWDEVLVYCQIPGQSVGGNPYWVMVQPRGWDKYGIMSSYYIENNTNWIDGVPGKNGCVI